MAALARVPAPLLLGLMVHLGGALGGGDRAAGGEPGPFQTLYQHKLRFVVGKQRLPVDRPLDEAAVAQAVEARNQHYRNAALDDLQDLNPEQVDAKQVVLFLTGLASHPAPLLARLARSAPLNLAAPGLGLHRQDGMGAAGLKGSWNLTVGRDGKEWRMEPEVNLDDAVAELDAAAAGEAQRQAELDAANHALAATVRASPDYPPVFRAQAMARTRIAEVQRVRLAATRRLLAALPANAPAGPHTPDALRAEVTRLETALRGAPTGGGMPGGIRPLPE